ncbi:hypothetical protein [Brevibacterium yomogidense]|uniref:hypothetical protein n=1 Tax=Brevibacterium yomogidense TaxID=946573 RepID=UPI0018DF6FD3|nr:hypothetical protein [Brevibacterium yomogidense]
MFGAIISTMFLVYAVLAVAMVVVVPVVLVARIRNELARHDGTEAAPHVDDPSPIYEEQEEQRQLTRVRLRTTAEAAMRSHDRILEEWVAHLQDEQIETAARGGAHTQPGRALYPAVQKQLLDALDAAQEDRAVPADPALDHYTVGLYATRVRELEAAWNAYRRESGSIAKSCDNDT